MVSLRIQSSQHLLPVTLNMSSFIAPILIRYFPAAYSRWHRYQKQQIINKFNRIRNCISLTVNQFLNKYKDPYLLGYTIETDMLKHPHSIVHAEIHMDEFGRFSTHVSPTENIDEMMHTMVKNHVGAKSRLYPEFVGRRFIFAEIPTRLRRSSNMRYYESKPKL